MSQALCGGKVINPGYMAAAAQRHRRALIPSRRPLEYWPAVPGRRASVAQNTRGHETPTGRATSQGGAL